MDPWYKNGLKFGCTQCGQCCTGGPGYVWITEEEVKEMAAFLDISPELFVRRYTRLVDNRLALVELKKSYDCIFLKDKKCQVYKARPLQCRTFPWWPDNLKSPLHWTQTKKRCEGIDHEKASVITCDEIGKSLEQFENS